MWVVLRFGLVLIRGFCLAYLFCGWSDGIIILFLTLFCGGSVLMMNGFGWVDAFWDGLYLMVHCGCCC